jgi:Flp pilus assembly protein TadG
VDIVTVVNPLPRLLGWLPPLLRDRRGASAILTAVVLTGMCGVIGLGLDSAVWYTNAHRVQAMVETSALSAAQLLNNSNGTSAELTAVAENNATLNGYTASTDTISVSFSPSNPPDATAVTVTATRSLPRLFSSLFLGTNPSVSASATATAAAPSSGVCILVLGSGSQTLLVNSSFNLDAPNCEIQVASTSSSAAMFDSNLPDIASACIAGGSTTNSVTVNNLKNDCTPESNPYKGKITAPTITGCTNNGENFSGTVNLSPGTYCGNYNFNGSGTINLSAGTYIFDNSNWNINSGWTVTGTGVTLYFATASSYVQFNSGVTVSLTAPTSGTYANILMFEPDGLSTSNIAIDGTSSSGHALQGVVYLPSRNITLNSTYSGTADSFMIIVNQLILDSNSPHTWSISPIGGGTSSSGSGSILTN